MIEFNKIYNEDCLVVLKRLPDKSVDMILQDPPYNTTACKWEWDIFNKIDEFWFEWKRVIKDNGAIVMTASQPFTSKLVMSNLEMFRYEWIWHKNFSGGFATAKKQPMKYHENILVFYRKNPTYNPQFEEYADSVKKRFDEGEEVNTDKQSKNSTNQIHNGFGSSKHYISFERGKYPESVQKIDGVPNCNGMRLHPTQKPVTLFEYLIKTYTNEGDVVFDGFSGSGTTAVACVNSNRNYICCELDKKYFDLSEERLKNMQPTLGLSL